MNDLFEVQVAHDPGGKIRTALPAGLKGDAVFSPCQRYRFLLRRWTGDDFPERFALWIGMNPSTATAEVNDPTITREWTFTARESLSGYAKVNVSAYRATSPRDLTEVNARHPDNLDYVRRMAREAALVIICHGKLNRVLTPLGMSTLSALRADGVDLWCLGVNGDGSPKHPLYLRSDVPLIRFLEDR